jgi:hypothetical protein
MAVGQVLKAVQTATESPSEPAAAMQDAAGARGLTAADRDC